MRRNIGNKGTGLYFSDVFNAKHLSIGHFPPRLKFNGFADFIINPDLKADAINIGLPQMRNDLSGFVHESTMPKLQFKTEVMNQYNIKRVVQTGVELQPVTMQIYDTVTNDWYEMLMTYYAYQYMNGRNTGKSSVINGQNAIAPGSDLYTRESAFMSDKFPSSASGFDANDTPHLFDAIRLVVVNGQQGREIMLQRPTITSMDFGEIDHAGNEPNIFSIEFEYENFVIGKVIENPLETLDIEKFSIYGTGNWTDDIAKSDFDLPQSEQNFRVKAGQPMPAADLMDASRRSQPQPQPPKQKKDGNETSNQQRPKIGRSI